MSFFSAKTPFNSFRINDLKLLHPDTRFLHIVRDRVSCADSISRNGFKYSLKGKEELSSEKARDLFYDSVLKNTDDRCFTILLEQLLNEKNMIEKLINWIRLNENKSLQ